MPPRSNLANQRFGKLTAIKDVGSNAKGSRLWLCECDCGNITTVASHELKRRTRSCGCLRVEILRSHRTLPNGVSARNRRLARYKNRAVSRDLEWSLLDEDFSELTQQACFYCGTLPSNIAKSPYGTGDYVYSGIDRVDNTEGYTKENCVSCCKLCNYMKSALTQDEFLSHIGQIINHQK